MAVTTSLKTTFSFADGTTRAVTVKPYRRTDAAVTGFKAKAINFNANVVDTIKTAYVSDSGAQLTGIKSAQIISVESTVVYGNVSLTEILANQEEE